MIINVSPGLIFKDSHRYCNFLSDFYENIYLRLTTAFCSSFFPDDRLKAPSDCKRES